VGLRAGAWISAGRLLALPQKKQSARRMAPSIALNPKIIYRKVINAHASEREKRFRTNSDTRTA
jgi:hypothetical protein